MLARDKIVTAIDVGTTKVCTLIGCKTGRDGLQIIGHSTVPNNGLRKGNVVDIGLTEKAIRESLQRIKTNTGHKIGSAFIGVTGAHIDFENRRNPMVSTSNAGVITSADMNRIPEAVGASVQDPERTLIQAINTSYTLDGRESVRNPLGMHSNHVEVETHVVTGGTTFIDRLIQAVEQTDVRVNSLVLEPLASGMAVLTADEKMIGTMVVDIGGGTTDLVGFKEGRVCYTSVIPIGGYQFTNDISVTYDTSYEIAEELKIRYATTEHYNVAPSEEITLPAADNDGEYVIKRYELCQLTRERAQELSQMIKLKINESGMGDLSQLSIVLTGGASRLEGLTKLMQQTLGIRVRYGLPNPHGVTIPSELNTPSHSTSVGILLWALSKHDPSVILKQKRVTQTKKISNGNGNKDASEGQGLLTNILSSVSNLMTPFTRSENSKRRF